ncbi:RHS repeat protein [Burkholderia stabilis]|uniref:RHS repeat protein n=1 Tax=Burkholderia stabilis TaxID=95485 RepID=A0A4V1PQU6_9BURK|nr:RHS repeat protein [Burkholderia stabilis]RXV65324.1 RHS repeat protein [Burkholderia stabilis]
MTLDELNTALAGKNWTSGWDGLLAISHASLQDALTFALNANTDAFLHPFAGELWHNSAQSAHFQASGLAFGPALLSFAGQALRYPRVTLRVPLVAGTLVEVLGGGASVAELASVRALAPEQGYWLEWQTDLSLLSRGSEIQVVLDLAASAREVRCNLSANEIEQGYLGEQLLAFLRGTDASRRADTPPEIPTTQFCLLRLPFQEGDWASIWHGDLLTYQAPGGSGTDGALLVFLSMDSKSSGHLPNPDSGLPYLIVDGSKASLLLGNPTLSAWLGRDDVPMLLQGLRPEGQRLVYQDRRVPHDLLLTLNSEEDGRLRIVPAAASVAAGASRVFTASGATLRAGTALWRAAAQVHPGATGTVTDQGLFTNAGRSDLHADTGIGKVRLIQVNGDQEERASAWVYSQASPVLQTGRAFVHRAYAGASAPNLYAIASGQPVTWKAPELGSLADAQPNGNARYVPPGTLAEPVMVDYIGVSIASGESSEAAVVLLRDRPDFMLKRNFAVSVTAGSDELIFGNDAERADGEIMNLADANAVEVEVINEGGGRARFENASVIYTPPAVVTRPADVILIRSSGDFGPEYSYIVVHTLPATEDTPIHWEDLSYFKLNVASAGLNPVYAYQNGYQQIQVDVEIRTAAVRGDDNKLYHFPITAEELESLVLVDLATGQAIHRLQPGQDGIEEEGVTLAFSTVRNVYNLGNVVPEPGMVEVQPADEGDERRTVRTTLYLHIKSSVTKSYSLAARIRGEVEPKPREFNSHEVSPTEGRIQASGKNQKALMAYLEHHPTQAVLAWKGRILDDGRGEYDYSRCDASTTYYELLLMDVNRPVDIVTAGLQEDSSSGMARWESDFWGEGGFSYTGFVPLGQRKISLPKALIDLNKGLRPSLAEGVTPNRGQTYSVMPLFNALRSEVALTPGRLLITLDRMDDMPWQWPQDTSEHTEAQFKAWRQSLEVAPVFRLRDRDGSLHVGSIGFPAESATNSNRDTLVWQPLSASGIGATPAAPAASLHSNAFNFLSYVQGGVDPRTGQYTVALELPAVAANDLAGPVLPLKLSFSSLASLDLGFGQGWSLNLSHIDTSGNGLGIVRLDSGESYRINITGPNDELLMSECKLVTFRLFQYQGGYRLVHRDGRVEYLRNPGFGSLALPVRIESPSGLGIDLGYTLHEGNARLYQVREDSNPERVLLQLDYDGTEAVLRLEATSDGEAARFVFKREQGRLKEILLPTEDAASWRIGYTEVGANNDYLCVNEFASPAGGHETITYHDNGHGVPGNARPPLPRVKTHTIYPGGGDDGADVQAVEYTWSEENFLGYNGISSWSDEEDNLYRLYQERPGYQYWSEAAQTLGAVRRTVKRTYNGLHLLVEEITQQNNHIQQQVTTYHMLDGEPIDKQPAQFQLPKTELTSWKVGGELKAEQISSTDYDAHGNLIKEVDVAGIGTEYTYYPANIDSEACPADPWGFTRHVKTQTVTPSPLATAGAPVRVTTYTHRLLPALENTGGRGETVLASETLTEQGAGPRLRHTAYSYGDDAGNPLTLGRLSQTVVTIGGRTTVTALTYAKQDGEWGVGTVLRTRQTITGYQGNEKFRYTEQAILNGLMLLERDIQAAEDVDIRRRYDALQRVIEETVAPGTDHEATRRYRYDMVGTVDARASQTVIDVLGVREQTWVDGLARPVRVDRCEPGAAQPLQTYRARYDSLGQLVSASEFDDCLSDGALLEMVEHYVYDDWGQRCSTTTADGVTQHERLDPITIAGEPQVRQVRTMWLQNGNLRSGREITWLDAAGRAVRVARYEGHDESGQPYSTQTTTYDGLGRVVAEVDTKGQLTNYQYDGFDRLALTTLPGGHQISRTYATHSDQDWQESISLDGKVLGTQSFDDLGRMTEAVTGGRTRTFSFDPGATRPKEVRTPRGATLEYHYLPRLGEEPIRRVVQGAAGLSDTGLDEAYLYERPDARLTSCLRGDVEILSRDYHSNGRLKMETRLHGTRTLTMHYGYSVAERLLSYTGVDGRQQIWLYDSAGRMRGTELSGLTSTLGYDSLGRDETITTFDSANGDSLAITLSYDAFGREIKRVFAYPEGSEVLDQTWDELDRITDKELWGSNGAESLRKERFDYDVLGHLERYRCRGSACPLDPYGHSITEQVFKVDALDNHLEVTTRWTDANNQSQQNVATYHYSADDPVQLVRIENDHSDYPAEIKLDYDPDGNLLGDEFGRGFEYDALDRLTSVRSQLNKQEVSSYYHYDPMDVIAARSEQAAGQPQEGRFYRDGELHTVLSADQALTIVRLGEHLIAMCPPSTNSARRD